MSLQGIWLIGLLGFAMISWWQIHSRLVLLQSRNCRVQWKTLGDNLEEAKVGMVGWEAAVVTWNVNHTASANCICSSCITIAPDRSATPWESTHQIS